jgi:hypothetical protein
MFSLCIIGKFLLIYLCIISFASLIVFCRLRNSITCLLYRLFLNKLKFAQLVKKISAFLKFVCLPQCSRNATTWLYSKLLVVIFRPHLQKFLFFYKCNIFSVFLIHVSRIQNKLTQLLGCALDCRRTKISLPTHRV